MGEASGSRAWMLTSPWFLGSILLLAVNDHVLKDAWPGWVTGKLSDVGGVAMVAIGLTVLVGSRSVAFGVTAVAFTVLKTVPAVALWAAPVLGGITRTDATDLVALGVLIPAWHVCRARPERCRRTAHALVLRIVVVGVAIAVTSATSTDDQAVVEVAGSDVYGRTDDGVFRSRDGGLTWQRVRDRSVPTPDRSGSRQACLANVCWSADDRGLIRLDDDVETLARPATPEAFSAGRAATFVEVTVDDEDYVVGWFLHGATRITADGRISWHPSSGFDAEIGTDWVRGVSLLVLFVAPTVLLVGSNSVRRAVARPGRPADDVRMATVLGAVGMLALAFVVLLLAIFAIRTSVIVGFAVAYSAVAIGVLGWSRSRTGRAPTLHPPRDLPPPDPRARVG